MSEVSTAAPKRPRRKSAPAPAAVAVQVGKKPGKRAACDDGREWLTVTLRLPAETVKTVNGEARAHGIYISEAYAARLDRDIAKHPKPPKTSRGKASAASVPSDN